MLILLCREVVGFFCGRPLEWPVAIKVGTSARHQAYQPPGATACGAAPRGLCRAELVNADSREPSFVCDPSPVDVTYGCLAPLKPLRISRR